MEDKGPSPWITTYSGKQFFYTHATVADIDLRDIAHGLSNCCRYAGQCRVHYSVAEHSVRMSEMAWTRTMKLRALMHDAAEAYMVDIPSLLKDCMPEYRIIESYLIKVIFDKYGVGLSPHAADEAYAVKVLDSRIRTPEVLSLFPKHTGWTFSWKEEACDYGPIRPWSAKKAERKFLEAFKKLHTQSCEKVWSEKAAYAAT